MGGQYRYTLANGCKITVEITKDCGMVPGRDGRMWHKVIAWALGFNNIQPLIIDAARLTNGEGEEDQ